MVTSSDMQTYDQATTFIEDLERDGQELGLVAVGVLWAVINKLIERYGFVSTAAYVADCLKRTIIEGPGLEFQTSGGKLI